MDSNASPSPDPESRRRSGRVVRAPEKFAPDAAHGPAKRKRGAELDGDDAENAAPLDSDEDMSEGSLAEDGESADHESDDDAAARRRAAKKKKAKPSRPRKPANKRVKTNGASAGAGKHPASLPSRPKKSVRIERLPEDGTGLFGQSR